jgi:hypothetical protein
MRRIVAEKILHAYFAVFAGPTGPRSSAAAAAADSDGKIRMQNLFWRLELKK